MDIIQLVHRLVESNSLNRLIIGGCENSKNPDDFIGDDSESTLSKTSQADSSTNSAGNDDDNAEVHDEEGRNAAEATDHHNEHGLCNRESRVIVKKEENVY